MIKLIITQNIKDEFKKLVYKIFNQKKLNEKEIEYRLKRDDKKVKFDICIQNLDKLLQKKLGEFDKNITFKKLIVADFNYLEKLTIFLNKNESSIELTKKEKEYFYTLYTRLKKTHYVKALGVSTCLYCNRNHIFNFIKKNQLQATAQIDHFFDKKTYPYLAISLYNLVPSCSTCNQRKSTKQENIIHPFSDSFDKVAKFSLKIEDSNFYYKENGFEIFLDTKNKKATNSIEVFNLNRLYQNHKDIILELIQKEAIYNESYLDELLTHYEGTLFKNREDLQRLIGGGYVSDEEIGKRPLSKLIKDISGELGLL